MKRYFYMLIIGIVPFSALSQTFVSAYDAYDAAKEPGQSYYSNAEDFQGASEPNYTKSLLYMFKATKDLKYLNEFVIHAKRVIERRDDNIYNIFTAYGGSALNLPQQSYGSCIATASNNYLPQDVSFIGACNVTYGNSCGWSMDYAFNNNICQFYFQEPQQTGSICYPFSIFVYSMLTDQDFINISNDALPAEAAANEFSIGLTGVSTFQDFANWLEIKICQSLSFEEGEWDMSTNYAYFTMNGSTTDEQLNQVAGVGCALILQYEYLWGACNCRCSNVSTPDYYGHIQHIENLIHSYLQSYNSPNVFFWYDDEPISSNNSEDLVHAEAVMEFANLCYVYNIPDINGNYFTYPDMQRLANTMTNEFYQGPNYQYAGSNGPCFCPSVSGLNSGPPPQEPNIGLDGYPFLASYNPYLYGILSNYYASSALYSPVYPIANLGQFGYSGLALYEKAGFPAVDGSYAPKNIFNPVAIGKLTGFTPPFFFTSATGGNFGASTSIVLSVDFPNHLSSPPNIEGVSIQLDNSLQGVTSAPPNLLGSPHNITSGKFASASGSYDCVAITNGSDLDIEYINSGSFESLFPSLSPFSFSPYFSGSEATLTSLHYNAHYSGGDDILAVDENGDAIIYEYNNSTPTSPYIMTNNQFTSNIIGITSGNFDGNSNSFEVATTDYSGNLYIYTINISPPNTFSITSTYSLATSNSNMQVNGFASGDFDGSGMDQIVLHSNYDGRYIVYKVVSGAIQQVGSQAYPDGDYMADGSGNLNYFTADQKWQAGVMTSLNSFPGSPGAILVTSRNADLQITLYDMQGECPGQNANGIYFSSTQTSPVSPCTYVVSNLNGLYPATNNPYTIDYNANNILTASNDIVSSGVSVQFTAGKTVDIQDYFDAVSGSNFDASIQTGLACSNDGYFHRPIHHSPPLGGDNSPLITSKPSIIDSIGVLPKPSPTTGQFVVSLVRIDSTEMGQEANVSVWNLLGEKVAQGNMLIEKDSYFPVDLSDAAKGVYVIIVKTKDKEFQGKVVVERNK